MAAEKDRWAISTFLLLWAFASVNGQRNTIGATAASRDGDRRLNALERSLRELQRLVDELKITGTDHQLRLDYLESCACKDGQNPPDRTGTRICRYGGESYSHGSQWNIDKCLNCRCQDSSVTCERSRTCEDEPTPTRPKSCQYNSRFHAHKSAWSVDRCTKCSCDDGAISCEKDRACNEIPVEPTPSGPKNCWDRGLKYKHNSRWKRDRCFVCVCKDGRSDCKREPGCGEVKPTPTPKNCRDAGVLWAHSTWWSRDKCTRCTCDNGNVKCQRQQFCDGGSIRKDCDHDGVVYRDLAVWSRDRCTICNCMNGTVSCDAEQGCELEPNGRRVCRDRGVTYQNQQKWRRDRCTDCICKAGTIECEQDPQCEQGIDNEDPCRGYCLNGGKCVPPPRGVKYPTCRCGPGFSGSRCGTEDDPCVVKPDPGRCAQTLLRYFFDAKDRKCVPFTYTGCGGNGNNFASVDACQSRCAVGTCCQRTLDTRASTYNTKCEVLDMKRCRDLHRPESGKEVVGFTTGAKCDANACKSTSCLTGVETKPIGESLRLGCQNCNCRSGGRLECRCQTLVVRKEIRDWTPDEVWRFQEAVKELKYPKLETNTSPWTQLTRLYASHIMLANQGLAFPFWNRLFLRRIEQALQTIDCRITLPYFEFATDAEKLEKAIIWQPNYFGGDGQLNTCVEDHPFGSSGPCISRQFNVSIGLPTIVDLAVAVKTRNYVEFSKMLEVFNAYYHSFVGGNLASTLAVNDPVFILIHTYIDRLFFQWENQTGHAVPRNVRDILMAPFNDKPSEWVKEKSCVDYRMPSEGTPCNYTEGKHSWEKYEGRYQGYNANGYDRNGWTIHGTDNQGFNRDGYNIAGYNRKGLDRLGRRRYQSVGEPARADIIFNGHCLNQLGLNEDGFDQYGYSVHGYDVHYCNYSYNGPRAPLQSFKIWETLLTQDTAFLREIPRTCERRLTSVPEEWQLQTWSRKPKSLSGLTPTITFDVGPRADSRFCLNVDNYPLICPCRGRMVRCDRNPCRTGQTCRGYAKALCIIDFCEKCTARWFVNGKEVRCNTGPVPCRDARGQTRQPGSSWRQGCEECRCQQSGQAACTRVKCPRVNCIDAVTPPGQCCPVCRGCEYRGRRYAEGANFRPDVCQTCRCGGGRIECQDQRPNCPKLSCPRPVSKPGQCCPVCPPGCEYQGRRHAEGARFRPNACQTCQCLNGNVQCSDKRETCPRLTCSRPVSKPGECCPMCPPGCEYRSARYAEGASFRPNVCQTCRCENSVVACEDKRESCPRLDCPQPISMPGECCPACPKGCSYKGRLVPIGSAVPSDDPCEQCACRQGNKVVCSTVRCRRDPRLTCLNPIPKPGECCPSVCASCRDQGREYGEGDRWRRQERGRCSVCECSGGLVECKVAAPCTESCRDGYQDPRTCCPTCTDCYRDRQRIPDGSRFNETTVGQVCRTCSCRRGNLDCQEMRCPRLDCIYQKKKEGHCCAKCKPGCEKDGQLFRYGDPVRDPDPCKDCICARQGGVQCRAIRCESLQCSHPVTRADVCCPSCDDCSHEGSVLKNGQSRRSESDVCKRCTCRDGSVTCERERCRKTCEHPIPTRECCSPCDNCQFDNQLYRNGEAKQIDACKTCYCRNGTVSCRQQECAHNCTHPLPRKSGQCCHDCKRCLFEGKEYSEGDAFFPHSNDPCYECTCTRGSVLCKRKTCSYPCTHPIAEANNKRCCPLRCDGCTYDNRTYTDGERFRPKFGQCKVCSCQAGNITCAAERCPANDCQYPAKIEGKCCRECLDCEFNGALVKNGGTFRQSADDPCSVCTCRYGNVECKTLECNTVCSHPVPGRCCPSCSDCKYGRMIASNGEEFRPDVREPCLKCVCRDGNVQCDTTCGKSCVYEGKQFPHGVFYPDVNDRCLECSCEDGKATCQRRLCPERCTHPVKKPHQCCPLCRACAYDGDIIEDGVTYTDMNSCQTCTCNTGNVTCNPVHCESATCLHPSTPPEGKCCPTCVDCEYNGRFLTNGGSFEQDPCTTCTCKDGTVHCTVVDCVPVTCKHPIMRPDQCCPVCPGQDGFGGCNVNGIRYFEGDRWQSRDEPCLTCSCTFGEVQCMKPSCPPTFCASEQKLITPTGLCCGVCQQDADTTCLHNGLTHQHKSEWPVNECTRCRCDNGRVQCETDICDIPDCPAGQTLQVAPGECCPRCVEAPGICIAYGDPHYRMFDGETIDFQGTCRYVMAQDCGNEDFRVEVQHHDRGTEAGVSWVEYLIVKFGTTTISLLPRGRVKINGAPIVLPYIDQSRLMIERRDQTILVNTQPGVKISWDGLSYVEVSVPGTYRSRSCGLCGNFNGVPDDDLETSSGQTVKSVAVFGNSWKVASPMDGRCSDAADINPCDKAGFQAKKFAATKCAILKDAEFSRCHDVVAPEPFYNSCVYDMCVCLENSNCLCDILSTYARECSKMGVKLNWRKSDFCAEPCPPYGGFVYEECGPPCPRTCENLHLSLDDISRLCYKPCTPGCTCPGHMVLHEEQCVPENQCPYYNR